MTGQGDALSPLPLVSRGVRLRASLHTPGPDPRLGSASVGGVHLHHAVPGLVVALAAGLLAFTPWGTSSPPREVLAITFGAGAALVLDEWALIFHLEDVYWSNEGRSSVDAVIIGTILAGILMHSASPFGVQESEYPGPRIVVLVLLGLNYLCALVCFFKGKAVVGAVGLLIPFVALFGAMRLAKPDSPWSRWSYGKSPRKLERSRHRYDVGWQGSARAENCRHHRRRAERRARTEHGAHPDLTLDR